MSEKTDELIAEVERLDKAATKGRLGIGIADPAMSPEEWFKEHASHGSGEIWCVSALDHPLYIGPDDKPEHAPLVCITGNGPTSKANAEYIIFAYAALPRLAALCREQRAEIQRLNRALGQYGAHSGGCNVWSNHMECNCGFRSCLTVTQEPDHAAE